MVVARALIAGMLRVARIAQRLHARDAPPCGSDTLGAYNRTVLQYSAAGTPIVFSIRQYEEDIRKLSTPEKVFAYFASSANEDGVPHMTPHDLLRAMVRVDKQRKSLPPTARFIHSLVRF